MSFKQWLAVAAWAFVPVAVTAQQKQSQYHPSDAAAPVSVAEYQSAFKTYRASNEGSATPDKVWRSSNEEIGRLGGHAGHMKDSAGQPAPSPAANGAAPEQGGAMDHGKHH